MSMVKYDGPDEFDIKKVMGNPYKILGVSRDAKAKTIKKAYLALSTKYHPDVFSGDKEIFILIGRAKDCLLDPKKRALYDNFYIFKDICDQSITRMAIQRIQNTFNNIVQGAPNLDYVDIKRSIQIAVEKSIDENNLKITDQKEKITKLEKSKKRVSGTSKRGKNLVHILKANIDAIITDERGKIANVKYEQMISEEMMVVLDEFECTFKSQETLQTLTSSSTDPFNQF